MPTAGIPWGAGPALPQAVGSSLLLFLLLLAAGNPWRPLAYRCTPTCPCPSLPLMRPLLLDQPPSRCPLLNLITSSETLLHRFRVDLNLAEVVGRSPQWPGDCKRGQRWLASLHHQQVASTDVRCLPLERVRRHSPTCLYLPVKWSIFRRVMAT